MTATGRPDVAIIGGGVMGCALAYYLARAGERVMLLEQSRVGSVPSASGASAAIVNLLVTAPDALLHQSLLTHQLLPELAADLSQRTGIDIGLTRPGSLRLAFDDRERPELESIMERYTAVGYDAEWLDAQAVRAIEPGVSPRVCGGVHVPGTYSLYAPHYVRALAAGAAAHGAVIRQGLPVTGLRRSGDRVVAIGTVEGQIEAGHVVLATGAWTGMVGAWLGLDVPIGPQRGQIMAVQTRPPLPHVRQILSHEDGYIVPKPNGTAVVGATRELVGWDGRLTPGGLGFLAKPRSSSRAHAGGEHGQARLVRLPAAALGRRSAAGRAAAGPEQRQHRGGARAYRDHAVGGGRLALGAVAAGRGAGALARPIRPGPQRHQCGVTGRRRSIAHTPTCAVDRLALRLESRGLGHPQLSAQD